MIERIVSDNFMTLILISFMRKQLLCYRHVSNMIFLKGQFYTILGLVIVLLLHLIQLLVIATVACSNFLFKYMTFKEKSPIPQPSHPRPTIFHSPCNFYPLCKSSPTQQLFTHPTPSNFTPASHKLIILSLKSVFPKLTQSTSTHR